MWDELRARLIDLGDEALQAAIIVVEAIIVLAVAVWIGRSARARTEKALARRAFGKNGAVLIGRLASLGVIFVACLFVLSLFGANWTGLLALVSVGTVAIGLALQDVLKNFIAGVYLLLERPFRVGDAIKVREVEGVVAGIDIRTTLIRNAFGEMVLIPNATVFTEIVTNQSQSGPRRLDLVIANVSATPEELRTMLDSAFADDTRVRRPLTSPVVKRIEPESIAVSWSVLYDGEPEATLCFVDKLRRLLPTATIEIESA